MNIFPDSTKVACCIGTPENCVCTHDERILRAYAYSGFSEPMTPEQRKACIDEADSAGEGFYRVDELSKLDDQQLASAVIDAWNMYVNSN